jgi:Uma2 family endonuclease
MGETLLKVGPGDHGRRMSLAEFEDAEAVEGHLYELGKGVVVVSGIPNRLHMAVVHALKRQLFAYDLKHPGAIVAINGGAESKILVDEDASERHPDLSVYKTPVPSEGDTWRIWVPELVIEVVSAGSVERDYEEKPPEYLRFGVMEYWIVDPAKGEAGEILVLSRSGGRWQRRVVRRGEPLTTNVLPGFVLDTAVVFAPPD